MTLGDREQLPKNNCETSQTSSNLQKQLSRHSEWASPPVKGENSNTSKCLELIMKVIDAKNYGKPYASDTVLAAAFETCPGIVDDLVIHGALETLDILVAALEGRSDIVDSLVEQGFLDNLTPRGISTPLILSSSYGNDIAVRILSKHRFLEHDGGMQALNEATRKGHHNVIQALSESGIDFLAHGKSAIISSFTHEQTECLRTLIAGGADAAFAIEMAMTNSRFEAFAAILSAADSNKIHSSVYEVMNRGKLQFVLLLVTEYGADPQVTINSIRSPAESKYWCLKYLDSKSLTNKISFELNQPHPIDRKVKL